MPSDGGIKEDPDVLQSISHSRPRMPRLAIVVPCHDEEETLPVTLSTLVALVASLEQEQAIAADSYVLCVDDGSRDRTWWTVCEAAQRTPRVRGLRLTRNFGQQGAMLAGLLESDADVFVTIDADLQDDETRIREMLLRYREGFDVVYGVRGSRERDSWFKRNTALAFYRFVDLIGGRIVHNHADFRLMSRSVVERLREFRESNLFLRGLIPMIGMPSTTVTYDRRAREAGETKYRASRLFGLAWEAITSLSVMPLRLVSAVGALVAVAALLASVWAVGVRFLDPRYVPGWASTLLPILLLGGIQILCMGIIGEYVGKIYLETKKRPRYLVGEQAGPRPVEAARERRVRHVDERVGERAPQPQEEGGDARATAQVLPIADRRQGDRRQGDRRRSESRSSAARR